MKIKQELADEINKQINRELESAYLYLSMAAYFDQKSLSGMAHWQYCQFLEEYYHARKWMDFLIDRGAKVVLMPIKQLKTDFGSAMEVFEDTLSQEILNTKYIEKILVMFREAKDFVSEQLILWFLDEQIEEEANAMEVIDKLKLIGNDGVGLLELDEELGERVMAAPIPEIPSPSPVGQGPGPYCQ